MLFHQFDHKVYFVFNLYSFCLKETFVEIVDHILYCVQHTHTQSRLSQIRIYLNVKLLNIIDMIDIVCIAFIISLSLSLL